jgi:uncharacterized damage-inducible protein DinB
MSMLDFLHIIERRINRQLDRALGDLTDEQWHTIPGSTGNSIAFIAWHYIRTEDNIINWIIQDRHPTVWMRGGWADKLGLPSVSQGTGMPVDEAQALRINDTAGFLDYMHQVRADTDQFLETWEPADYHTRILLKPVGEMTKLEALGQQGFPHGFGHIGEIQHIRCLLGLPGIGL